MLLIIVLRGKDKCKIVLH